MQLHLVRSRSSITAADTPRCTAVQPDIWLYCTSNTFGWSTLWTSILIEMWYCWRLLESKSECQQYSHISGNFSREHQRQPIDSDTTSVADGLDKLRSSFLCCIWNYCGRCQRRHCYIWAPSVPPSRHTGGSNGLQGHPATINVQRCAKILPTTLFVVHCSNEHHPIDLRRSMCLLMIFWLWHRATLSN